MNKQATLGFVSRWMMAALIGLAVAGCGDGLSGSKYTEKGSKDGIEFKSGQKAYITIMGVTQEAQYSVDGDKITLNAGGGAGTLVLTREKDGSITGLPMTGPLHLE